MHADDAYDEALDFLAPYGPDLRNGMTSHAPMAVEALCALGRGDAVVPWLERYRAGLLPRPQPRERIDAARWREALGREERGADWTAWFAEQLREAPWQDVLARWTAHLAPGICAAATHGVLRVAHVARALARRANEPRLDELANALGYWAATYQTLPSAHDGAPASGAAAALARVAIVPPAERRFTGTITGALAALDEHPSFAPVIGWLDVATPVDAAISDLTETFARACVSNIRDPLTAIVFVHGVTSSAALRAIAPHLDPATARTALRHAWQAGAALYAAFGSEPPSSAPIAPPDGDVESLVERAIAHGDEHAIKMIEACIAEHRRSPAGSHLAAAHRALEALDRQQPIPP